MTYDEAVAWWESHDDSDFWGDELKAEIPVVFAAIYGREPDEADRREGLWSHICAAMTSDGNCHPGDEGRA